MNKNLNYKKILNIIIILLLIENMLIIFELLSSMLFSFQWFSGIITLMSFNRFFSNLRWLVSLFLLMLFIIGMFMYSAKNSKIVLCIFAYFFNIYLLYISQYASSPDFYSFETFLYANKRLYILLFGWLYGFGS